MKAYTKRKFPVTEVRRLLEPGPIVLVSSGWKEETNIFTLGWHAMMGYNLIGCYIWDENYSHNLIKKSKECCINIPEVHLLDQTIKVGNSTGAEIDKFGEFGFTAQPAKRIKSPLIAECYANLECKVIDTKMVKEYSFFILQVVEAHVAISPKYPKTFHYRGNGEFMLSGENISRRRLFKPEMLKS